MKEPQDTAVLISAVDPDLAWFELSRRHLAMRQTLVGLRR